MNIGTGIKVMSILKLGKLFSLVCHTSLHPPSRLIKHNINSYGYYLVEMRTESWNVKYLIVNEFTLHLLNLQFT